MIDIKQAYVNIYFNWLNAMLWLNWKVVINKCKEAM